MKSLILLITLLAAFLSACSASPTATRPQTRSDLSPALALGGCKTNAECIQRGLPLRRPGTRTRRADSPGTSPGVNPYQYLFVIAIYRISDGDLVGYLQPENGETAIYRAGSKTNAIILLTEVAPGTPDATETSFKIRSPIATGFDWLGFNTGNYQGDGDIDPAGTNYGTLSNANEATSPGETCQPIDEFNGAMAEENPCVETAIWNYDGSTGEITAVWNNKDASTYGSTVQLDFLFSSFGALYYTGNAQAFINDNGGYTWDPVLLVLEYL